MADDEDHRRRSLAERARSVLSNVEQDDRFKQAAAATQDVASRAQEASKSVTRKVAQQDAWDELRGDVELLTEIARAHHALITDLIDRVAELEARAGAEPGGGHGG
jgi:DNA repair ATPase RecN